MSTFSGIVKEFPRVQIDNFRLYENHQPPLACFLSHIHSDHLTNLDNINSPFVYCTAPTRELLLKLEKYPHRMNFAKGILEVRKQTYRKVKRLLKPIPLETPTTIELTHGYVIQVTLFDANHCTGACMFLIEGDGKAILYTGDIRSEPWHVNSLVRNPIMIPYARDQKQLDMIYLDTTFAMGDALSMDFPTKADGLAELLEKVITYPRDTVFYLDAWTFGYEEVWIALCKALNTKVHLCDYRYKVYSSMKSVPECFSPHSAALVGFQLGNGYHEGCITNDPDNTRLHSCERGTRCTVFDNPDVVRITPIITRHKGVDVAEMGAGGGQGDLGQNHELELNDFVAVAQLIRMCTEQLKTQPELHAEIGAWFKKLSDTGQNAVKLDYDGFWDALRGDNDEEDILDDIPLDRLVPAIVKLVTGKSKDEKLPSTPQRINHITFPFSRHASFEELRCLVGALQPKDIYPCTVDPSHWSEAISMKQLFGDLCSGDVWYHDQRMLSVQRSKKFTENSQTSSQLTDKFTPEPPTPNKKRKLPHSRRRSDASTNTPKPSKKLARASPIVLDPQPMAPSHSGQPDPLANVSAHQATPSAHQATPRTETIARPYPVVTPVSRTRTLKAGVHTPSSNTRDRAAHRTSVAKTIKDGGTWQGLRSVNGYHNQKPEEEL